MTLIQWPKGKPSPGKSVFPTSFDLFTDLLDGVMSSDPRRTVVPAVNISETPDDFRIQVAAPGLNKEDFKIQIEEDVLTISASHKDEKNESTEQYTRKEFSFTSFTRSFTLPDSVRYEGITANYEKGIMQIKLPKMQEVKTPAKEVVVS